MSILGVNPTRMELTRLKKRLRVARRGHKLLKDKRDELMKQFLKTVREAKTLRETMERRIMGAHRDFSSARAEMSGEVFVASLLLPARKVTLSVRTRNIMSVEAPEIRVDTGAGAPSGAEAGAAVGLGLKELPYGLLDTSSSLDRAVLSMARIVPDLLALASLEKAAQLMAAEIERTRRRVNALEYVMIPDLADTIRYITMKLEENERGNITRLMKVKSMVLERARGERQASGS